MNKVQEETPSTPRHGTEGRHRALREALLRAAEQAVSREGPDGLRARDLAREAGCSVGSIYLVFPDLDALALAVNGRTLEAIDLALRATAPRTDDPRAALVGLAEAYLGYLSAHRARSKALFAPRRSDAPPPEWYQRQLAALFGHVEQPLAALRPDLQAAPRALLARTLFSAVHGIVAFGLDQQLVDVAPDVLRVQLRTVVDAMAAGLAPASARPRPAPRGPRQA